MRAVVLTAFVGLVAALVIASPRPASALAAKAALNYSHANADLVEVRRHRRRYYRPYRYHRRPYYRPHRYHYGRRYYRPYRYYRRPYYRPYRYHYGRRYYRPYRYRRRPGVSVYVGI